MINFDGISDNLATTLAQELRLFHSRQETNHQDSSSAAEEIQSAGDNTDDDDPRAARNLLTDFVGGHPEAERSVSRLVLKHLGISRSVLRPQRSTQGDADEIPREAQEREAEMEESRRAGINNRAPSREGDNFYQDDLIPSLSPVPWLPQESWDAMSYSERVELMEMAILGLSHPSASVRYRIFRSTTKYCDSFVMFGRGGVDRVLLGSGPRHVLVLVGIHGNETCGVEGARLILQRHLLFVRRNQTIRGNGAGLLATNEELGEDDLWSIPLESMFEELTIEFLVGNPRAVEADQRFMERNLNRLLDVHVLCDDEAGAEYEVQRARMLFEAIRHSDVVLDIHSVSSDSDPFALPASNDASEELAARLPVSYVVESLAHRTAEGGTTIDCALLHDVPAVCVECGQHRHPDIVARAADVISTFLLTQCNGGADLSSDSAFSEGKRAASEIVGETTVPVVMRCEAIEIVREGFQFVGDFKEFQFVKYGTPVYRDKVQGEVTCPIEPGGYLVMPTKSPIPGEEALFWARAV